MKLTLNQFKKFTAPITPRTRSDIKFVFYNPQEHLALTLNGFIGLFIHKNKDLHTTLQAPGLVALDYTNLEQASTCKHVDLDKLTPVDIKVKNFSILTHPIDSTCKGVTNLNLSIKNMNYFLNFIKEFLKDKKIQNFKILGLSPREHSRNIFLQAKTTLDDQEFYLTCLIAPIVGDD